MPDRIIRESACMSETLNELSDFAERFWWRLIVNCDDFGRYDARPKILKGRLFPLSESKTFADMQRALTELASAGLIEVYEVGGRPFLRVVKWDLHQRIRAKRSKFPEPADTCCQMTASADNSCRNPIQSNPSEIRNSECEMRNAKTTRAPAHDPVLAAVMTAFMNKINPTPSPTCIEELKAFAGQMGSECCIRAMDIALDAKKANWPYIRGVLRAKLQQGVKCIADWDEIEAKREAKETPVPTEDAPTGAQEIEEMRRFLASMRSGEEG